MSQHFEFTSPEASPACVPEWSQWRPTLRATLLFLVDEAAGRVLLIRKKRGLGAGKINGPGGKLEAGEEPWQCAVRETREELGIEVIEPRLHGQLWFQFVDGLALYAEVFRATQWTGEPIETEEALPLWTSLKALPFEQMWADDALWLGPVLRDQAFFVGRFVFDADLMLHADLQWLEQVPESPSWVRFS